MVNILFWNLNNQSLITEIAELCKQEDVDLLILAESKLDDSNLLETINLGSQKQYFHFLDPNPYLSFYYCQPSYSLELIADEGRMAIRQLSYTTVNRHFEMTIVAVHLPSKLWCDEDKQLITSVRVADKIRQEEAQIGHAKTLVIGDFNMNPFEKGLVAADGFHSVMTQDIANSRSRVVDGEERPYFYNPMWGRMGDFDRSPPGTYYYSSGSISYFWNTFDQVLLRPDLLPYFSHENLRVISQVGNESLLKNNKISKQFSDHLPISVSLDIEKE